MASHIDEVSQNAFRFCDVADEPTRIFLPPIEGYSDVPLLSLEDTIDNITSDYKDDLRRQALDAKHRSMGQVHHGLSIDEFAAIRLYTMEYKSQKEKSVYTLLNGNLRSERRSLLKPWFAYLKLLITALSKIPSQRRSLFRGVMGDLSANYQMGKKIIWWAFSSCTTSMHFLQDSQFYRGPGEKTLFEIECFSGKSIQQYSEYRKEQEVLLMAATELEVISCENRSDGQHIITLREIKPTTCWIDLPPWPGNVQERIDHGTSAIVELSDIRINSEEMRMICTQAIDSKHCRKLVLSNIKANFYTIELLSQQLSNSYSLQELDLSNNDLSDQDLLPLMKELAADRKHEEIKSFLCYKTIKESPMPPIKTLNLSGNRISDDGVASLIEVMKRKSLMISVSLNNNQITTTGLKRMCSYLSDREARLVHLYLDKNLSVNDECVDYWINTLQQNDCLRELSMTDCSLTLDGKNRLRDAIRGKNTFTLRV